MGRLTVCKGHYCFINCVEELEDEGNIRENCSMYNECYEKNIYDKLAHYEDLEEQGRLIVLPCAFGTDVYGIYADDCGNTNCLLNCDNCEKSYWRIYKTIFEPININNFDKTIFLTREEAEAKLMEMKGEIK